MAAEIVRLNSGEVAHSKIMFYTNIRQHSAPIISLGAIVEIKVANIIGLGLITRTRLTEYETSIMGERFRTLLMNPFDYLSEEYDEAWENAAGNALAFLCERHSHALHFEIPKKYEIPSWLRANPNRMGVRTYLNEAMENESVSLIPMTGPAKHGDRGPERDLIETDLAA